MASYAIGFHFWQVCKLQTQYTPHSHAPAIKLSLGSAAIHDKR